MMNSDSILHNKVDGYFTDDNSCDFYGTETSGQSTVFLIIVSVLTAALFFGWLALTPAEAGGDGAISIVGPHITSAE